MRSDRPAFGLSAKRSEDSKSQTRSSCRLQRTDQWLKIFQWENKNNDNRSRSYGIYPMESIVWIYPMDPSGKRSRSVQRCSTTTIDNQPMLRTNRLTQALAKWSPFRISNCLCISRTRSPGTPSQRLVYSIVFIQLRTHCAACRTPSWATLHREDARQLGPVNRGGLQ